MAQTMMARGSFISVQKLLICLSLLHNQLIERQANISTFLYFPYPKAHFYWLISLDYQRIIIIIQTYKTITFDHNQILSMPPKKVTIIQPKVDIPEGDAKIGKSVFAQNCACCHGIEGDGKGAGAPPLGGIMGRKAGSTMFTYSKPMKNASIYWSGEHIWMFLKNPGKYIPGNKMAFPGLGSDMEKAHLIAYLKTI